MGHTTIKVEVEISITKVLYFCFSAHTSKKVAKVIIVFIWVLAFSLAAPMAMSWEVIMEDEQDSGKLILQIRAIYNIVPNYMIYFNHRIRKLQCLECVLLIEYVNIIFTL